MISRKHFAVDSRSNRYIQSSWVKLFLCCVLLVLSTLHSTFVAGDGSFPYPSNSSTLILTRTLTLSDLSVTVSETNDVTATETGTLSATLSLSESEGTYTNEETVSAWSATSTGTVTLSPTMSLIVTETPTETRSITFSVSDEHTATDTLSLQTSETVSVTDTFTLVQTTSETQSWTMTGTGTGSDTGTGTVSFSETADFTYSPSITGEDTYSETGSATSSDTASVTDTATPTTTVTRALTLTGDTATLTVSQSQTHTDTSTLTTSESPSVSGTVTLTQSQSYSGTATRTSPDTVTISHPVSGTITGTLTVTDTNTLSSTSSLTSTVTESASAEETMSDTETGSQPDSVSTTESLTVTGSESGTKSLSPEKTMTGSISPTITISTSISGTRPSGSKSYETVTRTVTSPESGSQTNTRGTRTETMTFIITETSTHPWPTQSYSQITSTLTPTASDTGTKSLTDEYTSTESASITGTESRGSITKTESLSASSSETRTFSGSQSTTGTLTNTISDVVTSTLTLSRSLTWPSPSSTVGTDTLSFSPPVTTTNGLTLSSNISGSTSITLTADESSSESRTDTLSSTAELVITPSVTVTRSISLTETETGQATESAAFTDTLAGITHSKTVAITETMTNTFSETETYPSRTKGTVSKSATMTFSDTTTETLAETKSLTQTSTETITSKVSETISGTLTAEITLTETKSKPTLTQSNEATLSESDSVTRPWTDTQTITYSPSVSGTTTLSRNTPTGSHTQSLTGELTMSESISSTTTVSSSLTGTESPTYLQTYTKTEHETHTYYPNSRTSTATPTTTVTFSLAETNSPSKPTWSQSYPSGTFPTSTFSRTETRSESLTDSRFTKTVTETDETASNEYSLSASKTITLSLSGSMTVIVTETPTTTITNSFSRTLTHIVTESSSFTITDSDSPSHLPTVSPSFVITGTDSPSVTQSGSQSESNEPTLTESFPITVTISKSPTEEFTASESQTRTETLTQSIPRSKTFTLGLSHTSSLTPSIIETVTVSDSLQPTTSNSVVLTHSATPTDEFTLSESLTLTKSETPTGETPSTSPTNEHTMTESIAVTLTISRSPSITETISRSGPSHSSTFTLTIPETMTPSISQTHNNSKTTTVTMSVTESKSGSYETLTITPSAPVTKTSTITETKTLTENTHTKSGSESESNDISATETISPSVLVTPTYTITLTPPITLTSTATESMSNDASLSNSRTFSTTETKTDTLSTTITSSITFSDSKTYSGRSHESTLTATPTDTRTASLTFTESESYSTSESSTFAISPSYSLTTTQSLIDTETSSPSFTPTFTATDGSHEPTLSGSSTYTLSVSPIVTYTGTVTLSKTNSNTQTETLTLIVTPTPPPTPSTTPTYTMTETITPTGTFTHSMSDETTHTGSNSPTVTGTLTLIVTNSHIVTLTRTLIATPTRTKSFTLTDEFTASGPSFSLTVTGTMSSTYMLTQTITPTPPPTPTPTPTYTLSLSWPTKTRSGSQSETDEDTMTESATSTESSSRTWTDTESLTKSETETPSKTRTMTVTIDTITDEAYFTTIPIRYSNKHPIKKELYIQLHNVPYHHGSDFAGIVPTNTTCHHELNPISSHPSMQRLTFTHKRLGGNWVQNWSVSVPSPGWFTLCYYNSEELSWYVIDRTKYGTGGKLLPSNLTFVPEVTIGWYRFFSLGLNPPFIGRLLVVELQIVGANATTDDLKFVKYPHRCNDLVTGWHFPLNGYIDPVNNIFQANSSTALQYAQDYRICYRGFPNIAGSTTYTTISLDPVRAYAEVSHVILGAGQPPRTFRPLQFHMAGAGLGIFDEYLITNDTVARCSDPVPTPERFTARGYFTRVVDANKRTGQTAMSVNFLSLPSPGDQVLCFRGNTSRGFTEIYSFNVAPIRATAFTPNKTITNLSWPVNSHVALEFVGDEAIDNRYDLAWLHLNETGGCSSASNVRFVMRADPLAINVRQWVAKVTVPGNYSVCYQSNVSQQEFLGIIEASPIYYSKSLEALNSVFLNGVNLRANYSIFPIGLGIEPATDPIYVIKKNFTSDSCFHTPPAEAIFRLEKWSNHTSIFNASDRGYYVFCYINPRGDVFTSETFAIFPEAPSLFTPRMIPMNIETNVSFHGGQGMDLTDGDVITFCGTSMPLNTSSVVGVERRILSVTATSLGNYSLCFISGVVSPANAVPFTKVLVDSLQVSPILTKATVSPRSIPINSAVNITLEGHGLSPSHILYLCNTSDPTAPPTELVNTTTVTLIYRSVNRWTIKFAVAGEFPICYQYRGTNPAFPHGSTGANAYVDPLVISFYPSTIQASKLTVLNFTGLEMEKVTRMIARPNVTVCDQQRSPFDTEFTKINGLAYSITLRERGMHMVCYQGPSGMYYPPSSPKLFVKPWIDTFTATQQGVSVTNLTHTIFFSNYPIDVHLVGGAMNYQQDKFWAVTGSDCAVASKNYLTRPNPPLVSVDAMTLTFVAPSSGAYRVCHAMDGATHGTRIHLVINVQNSLIYFNNTLMVRGPVIQPNVLYIFSFTKDTTDMQFTPFQSSTSSPFILVPYVPVKDITFQCQIVGENGVVINTLQLKHFEVGDSKLCGSFPQSVSDPDAKRQYAMAIILMHNFVELQCYNVLAPNSLLDASNLLTSLLRLVSNDPTLLVDIHFAFEALAGVIVRTKQLNIETFGEMELLFDATMGSLNKPNSEISESLLLAHLKIVEAATQVVMNDPSVGSQAVVIKAMDRLLLVGKRYCESLLSANGAMMNQTQTDSTVSIKSTAIGATLNAVLEGGFSVTTTPHFFSSSTQLICIQSVIFRQNFIPQRSSTLSSGSSALTAAPAVRRNLQELQITNAPPEVIPTFNFPVFVFSLPASTYSKPLTMVRTVEFKMPFSPVTRPPGVTGSGVIIEAEFYRFVPDGGQSGTGQWLKDKHSWATGDEKTNVMVIHHNASAAVNTLTGSNSPTNYFMLSGKYVVKPIAILPPEKDKDIWIAIFVGGLAVLHIILFCVGLCVDKIRDERYQPNADSLMKPEDGISLHRYLSMGVRKPHHPIHTWVRVTTGFTFLFACSLCTLLTVLAEKWDHPHWQNWVMGFAVAASATPFGALTRIPLHLQLRDYGGGIAAVLGVAIVSIAMPIWGPRTTTILVVAIGVPVFALAVAYFRSRWSMALQPRPGPFPAVFGCTVHIIVEVVAVAYCCYTSLVTGTPIVIQKKWHFFQILGAAVVIDCFFYEPIKNRVILFLRKTTLHYDAKAAIKQSKKPQDPIGMHEPVKTLPGSDDDISGRLEEYYFDEVDDEPAFVDVASDAQSATEIDIEGGFEDVGRGTPWQARGQLGDLDEVSEAGHSSMFQDELKSYGDVEEIDDQFDDVSISSPHHGQYNAPYGHAATATSTTSPYGTRKQEGMANPFGQFHR